MRNKKTTLWKILIHNSCEIFFINYMLPSQIFHIFIHWINPSTVPVSLLFYVSKKAWHEFLNRIPFDVAADYSLIYPCKECCGPSRVTNCKMEETNYPVDDLHDEFFVEWKRIPEKITSIKNWWRSFNTFTELAFKKL